MTKQKLRGWSQPQIKYETANQAKQGGLQAHYRNRKGVCVAKRGEVGGDRRLFAEITVVATQWPSRELLPRITRGRRGFMPIMIYKGRSWCSNCWLFCNYLMDSFWSYLGWISISIRKEFDFFAVLCLFPTFLLQTIKLELVATNVWAVLASQDAGSEFSLVQEWTYKTAGLWKANIKLSSSKQCPREAAFGRMWTNFFLLVIELAIKRTDRHSSEESKPWVEKKISNCSRRNYLSWSEHWEAAGWRSCWCCPHDTGREIPSSWNC